MSDFDQFCERLQERLSVDASYLPEDIPNGVRRAVKRLLRDYHFPKSVRTHVWANVGAGSQAYTLPSDFKKDLLVVFQDTSDSVPAYTAPLRKSEGFMRPQSDGVPRLYWLQGLELWTDISVPAGTLHTNLVLAYESNDADIAVQWLLQDFEDVLFSLCMFRLSSELGKPELAQTYVALWTEDQRSLAIYLNELEFNGLEVLMREAAPPRRERYPST